MNSEFQMNDEQHLVRIEKMLEFSMIVRAEEGLKMSLREGTAEIFGRELPMFTMQHFPKGERFTIFTWTSCTLWLEYNNHEDFFLLTEKSLYPVYANINQYLHELRGQAQQTRKIGPRVLVCGENQSGKTTVAHTLTNYCCKQGWSPILVDLDPLINAIMGGGCIGACVCKDFYPSSGVEVSDKIVFYHGYSRVQMPLLKNQIEVIGSAISKKLATDLYSYKNKQLQQQQQTQSGVQGRNEQQQLWGQNDQSSSLTSLLMPIEKRIFASGCIINMPPMGQREQKEVIDLIVKHFGVDVIVGLDDEVCNSLRQNLLLTNGYSVIRTSKPCGLKNKKEDEQLEEARKYNQKLFQHYFMGINNDIYCHSQQMNLSDLLVYRFRSGEKNGVGIGQAGAVLGQRKLGYFEKVDLQKELVTKSIVGVLNLPRSVLDKLKEEEEIFEKISRSTLGLLFHLSDMLNNQQVRLFLPGLNMESIIKENVCVIGDITWFQSSSDKKR